MRHNLYQNFYFVLKRFVAEEDFIIEFEFFNEKYVLGFDKNFRRFKLNSSFVSFEKPEHIYQLIKIYVEKQIIAAQKENFNGSFVKERFLAPSLDKKEKEIYFELVDKFEELLWNETISALDIGRRGCMHRLQFGFSESKVSSDFLVTLLDTLYKHPEAFESGILGYWMWDNTSLSTTLAALKNDLFIFKEEGYIILEQDDDTMIRGNIAFTEKFYNGYKKAFYYDYDPRVKRPQGCIYA